MKHLLPALLFFLSIPVYAQYSTAHIVLEDGAHVSGIVLAVQNSKVFLQPDMSRQEVLQSESTNITAVCDGAIALPFSDIDSLYLERSSDSWLLGIPVLALLVPATILIGGCGHNSFGGSTLAAAAGLVLGTLIGGTLALILHYNYGSDFYVNLLNPGDIQMMQESAMYPESIPPCLRALE